MIKLRIWYNGCMIHGKDNQENLNSRQHIIKKIKKDKITKQEMKYEFV